MCVYVKSLSSAQGQKIQGILRRSKSRTMIRRAQVILLSDQGMQASDIANSTYLHTEYVRELIRRFNREGLGLFKERPRSGRPVTFTEEIRAEIVQCALSPPRLLGQPFSRWSIAKLREYLISEKVVKEISIERLRQILREEKIRLHRTKTWKESNDPEFQSKKNA